MGEHPQSVAKARAKAEFEALPKANLPGWRLDALREAYESAAAGPTSLYDAQPVGASGEAMRERLRADYALFVRSWVLPRIAAAIRPARRALR